MIGRVWWVGTVVLAVFGLTVGCGSDRPKDVALDELEACDLILSSELGALQVKAPPQWLDAIAGAGEEGTSCSYSPQYGGTVHVGAVTNQGIDEWTSGSKKYSTATDMPRILGYRTIKVELTDFPDGPHDSCRLYVDVASDQSLKIDVGENSEDEPPTCEIARQFGKAAMVTLTR